MARSDTEAATEQISLYHHFVAETEGTTLSEFVDGFERTHRGRVIEETSDISELRLHVKSRILRGDPPTVWDEWPGENLRPTVEAGAVADITDIWRGADMEPAFVEGAKDAVRFDGRFHAVPFDLYRINNCFYNRSYAREAGFDPRQLDDPEALADALDAAAGAADLPPFVISGRNPLMVLQLWETVLVGLYGPEKHRQLTARDGTIDRSDIAHTFEVLERLLRHTPTDWAFLSSMDADVRFVDGKAGLTQNGGWSIGRFADDEGFEFGTDWDATPFPGTGNVFLMNMNSFVPSTAVAENDTAQSFIEYAGSAEGIERISRSINCLPPRTDVSTEHLHPLIQRHQSDLDRETQLLSFTHGLTLPPDELIELKSVIPEFVSSLDLEEATDAFMRILVE